MTNPIESSARLRPSQRQVWLAVAAFFHFDLDLDFNLEWPTHKPTTRLMKPTQIEIETQTQTNKQTPIAIAIASLYVKPKLRLKSTPRLNSKPNSTSNSNSTLAQNSPVFKLASNFCGSSNLEARSSFPVSWAVFAVFALLTLVWSTFVCCLGLFCCLARIFSLLEAFDWARIRVFEWQLDSFDLCVCVFVCVENSRIKSQVCSPTQQVHSTGCLRLVSMLQWHTNTH